MAPMEPNLEASIGHDGLQVWMDFWELTGRLRVDIIRRSASGGDPASMQPPDVSIVTIPSVAAIIIKRETGVVHDRAGEISSGKITLELIDTVRDTDRISMGGNEHEIDSVEERDLGDFVIWIVTMHRI